MNVRCMASLELGRVFAPDFLENVERENGYEYPVPFLTLEFPMHVHVSVFSHTIADRPVA